MKRERERERERERVRVREGGREHRFASRCEDERQVKIA